MNRHVECNFTVSPATGTVIGWSMKKGLAMQDNISLSWVTFTANLLILLSKAPEQHEQVVKVRLGEPLLFK